MFSQKLIELFGREMLRNLILFFYGVLIAANVYQLRLNVQKDLHIQELNNIIADCERKRVVDTDRLKSDQIRMMMLNDSVRAETFNLVRELERTKEKVSKLKQK